MFSRTFSSLFGRNKKKQPIRNRKVRLNVELLEDRVVPASTITKWDFNIIGPQPANFNSPIPTTGVGTAVSLGMDSYTNANGTNTQTTDDVLASAGVITPSFSEQTWRIRGDLNGWALSAPQYTQGIELDASTAGYSGTQFSFDWYSTTQGVRDLQVQINTGSGWNNYIAPNETGSATGITAASESGTTVTITTAAPSAFTVGEQVAITGITTGSTTSGYDGLFKVVSVSGSTFTYTAASGLGTATVSGGAMATPSSIFIATANDFYTPGAATTSPNISINLPAAADNNATVGIRLVSAYDPGMYNYDSAGGVTYASAAGNGSLIYNNNSGNWRFDNMAFSGTPVPGAVFTNSVLSASPVSPQNPSTSVTFTDVITPTTGTDNPIGTVAFFDGSTQIGTTQTVTNGSGITGTASITTSDLAVFGSHNITALYTPDSSSSFINSANTISFTIGDPTTTTLAVSPVSPQIPGTGITLTATITPANIGGSGSPDGNPTGTVAFFDGATQVGTTQTVTNGSGITGTASVTINTGGGLTLGLHNFTAVYSPPQTSIIAFTAATTTSSISAATESGTTVTITTVANHNLVVGQQVTVAGIGTSGYNGTFTVTGIPTSKKFTYTASSGLGSAGSLTGATAVGTTATITTSTASGFVAGQAVDVSGITPSGYNGTYSLNTASGTTLTFPVAAGGFGAATSSSTALVTNDGVTASDFLTSASTAAPYTIGDPTTSILSASPNSPQQIGTNVTFTDTITPANLGGSSSPAGTPTGTVIFFDNNVTDAIQSASESGTTVTITTTSANNFVPGQTVTIAGISPSGYDGNFTITGTGSNNFTYTAASGLGTATLNGPTATSNAQIGTTQTVTAGSGSTGTASVSTGALSASTHNITAVYTATSPYLGSSSPSLYYALFSGTPGPLTPGNLVVLQAGDGTPYNAQAQLYLDELNPSTGNTVQQDAISAVGTINITAASESDTTVTITTGDAPGLTGNGFTSGEQIAIAGITPSGYDGTFVITVVDAHNFTYTATSGLGTATITGATASPGIVGNNPITIDLSAAAGNGQLTRSYDGSAFSFGGVDSTINNGGLTSNTPSGASNRVIGVLSGGDATLASALNTTTAGAFYMGDDNRGAVAESPTGPIYSAGHPNQAGGAVSQGVHEFDTTGPSIGTQVSASQNIRGINIGFDNRMYFSTAGGLGGATALNTAGIFTEAQSLPSSSTPTPVNDIQVVPAIFGASKLGGLFLADMNSDGIVDNGDRLYFVDDGTVGGAGTGGLYVSTWNDTNNQNPWNTPNNAAAAAAGFINHWGVPVRLGDAPTQPGSGNVGQLRGITGTVVTAGIASASESDTTVTITLSAGTSFSVNQKVQISGVGAGYDGSWTITGISGTTLTFTAAVSGLDPVSNSTGTASQAVIYTNAYDGAANDNSIIQQWVDTGTGVSIASASVSGTTVTITTLTPNTFRTGQRVEVDGVGANSGASAITSGYNGAWIITVTDSTHFTYTDTNSGASSLPTVTNQGGTDLTVNGSIILSEASGSVTIAGKTYGAIGLRGVSFAPVAATSVTLSQSPANPLSPGTGVTLTADLSNTEVTSLTGTVAFIDQNTNTILGFGTIGATNTNEASLTLPTGLVGNHYVQAYFAGGGSLALASARSNTIQVIEAGNTASTTTVVSNLPAAAIAKSVTFTATVTTGATGTVSFFNGAVALANLIGTSSISGSTATLTTAFGTAGTQTIFAVYNGDNTYASSQGSTTVNVAPNATATITSSANNVALGSIQTYTATIVGNATLGTPGGTVTFTIRSATGGSSFVTTSSSAISVTAGPNNTATATWTGPALSVAGSYFVTITYNASGATNPYSSFAITTTNATNGNAFIETVKQAFTPGNLVAVQRGDGTVNLGSAGYPVMLDEYTPGGTLVQAIAMPNVDAGSQHALFLTGQSGAEGLLNRSANGYFLTLAGYDLPAGTTFVTSTFPFQYPRTIAEVNGAATVNASTAISTTQVAITAISESTSGAGTTVAVTTSPASGFVVGQKVVITGVSPAGFDGQVTVATVSGTTFTYTASTTGLGTGTLSSAKATASSVPYNPLDVVSNDGNEFWLASDLPTGDIYDNGILYVGSVGATSATQIGSGNNSAVAISIAGGQLYVTKGSGNVQAVGTGLPTTTGQSTTSLPNLANAYATYFPNKQSPEKVLLLNTNDGTTNNPNVAYVADQANGLLKFYLNNAGISTLTEDGSNNVTVTTSAPNTFVNGDQVQIAGASVAGYNGTFTITVVDPSTFTYTLTTPGLADATGGTASEWAYGINNTGVFGQKLVFAGGATGVTGYVINPGSSAQVRLYITGSNVTQQNPNQLDTLLDTHTPSQGFPSGNFTNLGFVGGAGPAGSPNGNENFAGLSFVPGYITSTTVSDTGPGASNTFTATVTSVGGNVPTGVVIFSVDGAVVGQSTLNSSGVATFTDSSYPAGTHIITAAYQGDVKDGTSTGTLTQGGAAFTSGNYFVVTVGVAQATISTITESGTTATVTTTAPHGYAVGESVFITGSSVSGYNSITTSRVITSVPSSTTFTYTATSGLGSSTGGTVTFAPTSVAAPAQLNEYTTGGTLVQSIPLAFTEIGTNTGAILTDAPSLADVMIGYTAAPGSSVTGAAGVIGVIHANGSIESSTQISSTDDNNSLRSAASADGLGFYVTTANNVRYVPFGNNVLTPTTTVSNFFPSPKVATISESGQLYVNGGAGAQSNGVPAIDGPAAVGAGLPQVGGQVSSLLLGFPTAADSRGNFPVPNQFVVSPDGNTIFVADGRTDGFGGIQEFYQSSPGSWLLRGSLQLNSYTITSASESGNTVTITYSGGTGIASNDFTVGQNVEIDSVGTGYNTTSVAATFSTTSNTFTYTSSTSGLATVNNSGLATGKDGGLVALCATFSGSNVFLYGTTTSVVTATSGVQVAKILGGTVNGSVPAFNPSWWLHPGQPPIGPGIGNMQSLFIGSTPSTTTLSALSTPTTYSNSEILTAAVTDTGTSAPVTSGWVSFQANGKEIGSALVDSSTGIATFDVAVNLQGPASPFVNPENIVAVFMGNSTYAPSTSTPVQTVTVNTYAPTTNLTAAIDTVATGVADTLTATIMVPAGTNPTGTVTFWDGPVGTGVNLGTAPVSQVIVSQLGLPTILFASNFTTMFSTAGTHDLSAVYSGDNNFSSSTGTHSVLVVNPTTTVVTTDTTNAADSGASVNLTATVSGVAGTPTGTVQFYDNLLPIGGPVTLSGGSASVNVTTGLTETTSGTYSLTPGLHSITAVYVPDVADQTIYFTSTGVYEQAVQAQAFGTSDVFIERVGDGITNLLATSPNPNAGSASVGSSIYVDEYTTAGALVQSIILPSYDGAGSQAAIHAVVADAQQSSTGQLTLSGDGQYLFLTGYDSSVNGANLGTAPELHFVNSTSRAVARVKFDGMVQTIGFTAGSSGVQTGGNINGVYSPDGNKFYVSGFNGIKYFSSFTPSAALQAGTATIDSASITVAGLENDGGNLALVNSAATNNNPVQQYTGFPTTSGSAGNLTGVTGANATAGGQASTFTIDAYFTHLNGSGAPAGINTFYLSDDGPSFAHGAITKWALVSGTWTAVDHITAGTNNTATSFYWLAGITDGSGNVTLNATYGNGGNGLTGPGFLYSISDTNGWDAPIGTGGTHSDDVSTVASVSSTSNEVFRGVVALTPQAQTVTLTDNGPNPSTDAQSITLSVTVTSPASYAGPTGTVTLEDASNGNAVVPTTGNTLANGTATLTVAAGALSAGSTHNLFVVYNGDTYHQSQNSNSVSQSVLFATTTTLADNGPNPSNYGQDVQFTVTVSGGPAFNGTVEIEDTSNANAVVASPTLVNGTATFNISSLLPGSHVLVAVYDILDGIHAGSTSPSVTQVVGSAAAPAFQSIEVNGGTVQYHDAFGNGSAEPIAGQNSVVEQILVTFNEPVTLDPGAFSIVPFSINDGSDPFVSGQVLVNSGPNPNQVAPIVNTPVLPSGGDGHQWIITFGDNAATTPNGSGFYVLKDGVYSVNIDHTRVHANSQDMAADVGGPGASAFYALYGDTTFHQISGVDINIGTGYIGDTYSDASVGNTDFAAFKACYNSDSTNYYAPPSYNIKFDANLDGSVANSDFVQFKTNYNTDWQF
jgi:large repetitive protein